MTTTTGTAHECSFPCNPPGGTFFAPGPCKTCGKTYDRAQAEILLAEAVAAMDATEPPGAVGPEQETVDDLRRELVQDSASWREAADRNRGCAHREGATPAVRDAYTGSLMAANYSYTLAAVLAVARREYGESAARRLAFTAATVLADGDFDDLNADVTPTTEATPTRK